MLAIRLLHCDVHVSCCGSARGCRSHERTFAFASPSLSDSMHLLDSHPHQPCMPCSEQKPAIHEHFSNRRHRIVPTWNVWNLLDPQTPAAHHRSRGPRRVVLNPGILCHLLCVPLVTLMSTLVTPSADVQADAQADVLRCLIHASIQTLARSLNLWSPVVAGRFFDVIVCACASRACIGGHRMSVGHRCVVCLGH